MLLWSTTGAAAREMALKVPGSCEKSAGWHAALARKRWGSDLSWQGLGTKLRLMGNQGADKKKVI